MALSLTLPLPSSDVKLPIVEGDTGVLNEMNKSLFLEQKKVSPIPSLEIIGVVANGVGRIVGSCRHRCFAARSFRNIDPFHSST